MAADSAKTCILGAGLTGLSTAYHWPDDDYIVLEKAPFVGGNCRTEQKNGFYFDSAGHIFYPKQAYTRKLVEELMGENLHEADREAWIYVYDTFVRYPFQANLYGLPPAVLQECLEGLHQATLRVARDGAEPPANFLDFIYRAYGDGIAEHFMVPFNKKHHRIPLDQLNLEWMAEYVPRPSFEQALAGSIRPAEKCLGQNARFLYPMHGGIGAIASAFVPHINSVELGAEVTAIDLGKQTIEINRSRVVGYEQVVSTLPLPVLVACLTDPPAQITQAAARLRWNSLIVVNVAVDRPSLTKRHRIYYPDEDLSFHKLGFYSTYAPEMSPRGQCAVSAEISYSNEMPIDLEHIEERVVDDLRTVKILAPNDEILFVHTMSMPYAYAIYDKHRKAASMTIRDYFAARGVHCWGRYGEWAYQNMETNILTGRQLARNLNRARPRPLARR